MGILSQNLKQTRNHDSRLLKTSRFWKFYHGDKKMTELSWQIELANLPKLICLAVIFFTRKNNVI